MKTKNIQRSYGDKTIYGNCKVSDKGVYTYQFYYNRELNKHILSGDYAKLSKLTGFTQAYVLQVLEGARFNEKVLRAAEIIAEFNLCIGVVTTNKPSKK